MYTLTKNHFFCQTYLVGLSTFCIIKVPHINSFMYNYYTNATNELFLVIYQI